MPEPNATAAETEESVVTSEEVEQEETEQTEEEEAEASGATQEEEEEQAETSPASETGNDNGKPRKLSGWQKKVNRLTKRASSAEDALENERRTSARLREQLEGKAPASAKTSTDDPEPKEDDFKSYKDFVKAMSAWQTRQTVKAENEKRDAAAAQQAEAERQEQTYAEHLDRLEAAKQAHEDWDDVTEALSAGVTIPPAAGIAIVEAENGPEVMYYLATHPDELKALSDMTPMKAAMKIGALSDKLPMPTAKPSVATKKPAKKVSSAPAPVKPVGGGSAKTGVADLSKAGLADYMKARGPGKR